MNVVIVRVAEEELVGAVAYYNQQSEGLGYEFAAEITRTIGRIVGHPDAWAALSTRTRRCRCNRFPFGVVYEQRGETILIVAVMHLHRHPESWKGRGAV